MSPPSQPLELQPRFSPRPQISHVVFDFDGTLSWLRHGWPEMMAGLFLKQVIPGPDESAAAVHELILGDILSLNGKPSIHQMERCAKRVQERGGRRLDPQEKLLEYQTLLQAALRERIEKLRSEESSRDEYLVYGARTMLEKLRARGLVLIILSGTEQPQVVQEAKLLQVQQFFGSHVYGSTPNVVQSSKQAVIERLLIEEGISGEHLLSFGDGPVEIQVTKQAGGLAVGVASDENINGSGQMDRHKVRLLREAGADELIADYRDANGLLERLLGPIRGI